MSPGDKGTSPHTPHLPVTRDRPPGDISTHEACIGRIDKLTMVTAVQYVMIGIEERHLQLPVYLVTLGRSPEEGHRCPMLAAKHSEPGRGPAANYRDGSQGPGQGTLGSLLSPLWASPVTGPSGIGHVSRTATHEVGTATVGPI